MYLTADMIVNQIDQKDLLILVNIRIYNIESLELVIYTDNIPL